MKRYYGLAVILILLDQLTKWVVVQTMTIGQSIEVIPNLLYWTSYRNKGAAWGMLEGQMAFFFVITILVVVGLVYFLHKEVNGYQLLGYSVGLLLAGAIGNFIDRLFRGEVVDFVDTYPFGYNFPIFNVADMALTFGVILMVIGILFEEKLHKERGQS
ncbi:signal peptidase II [Exiguobacterium aestuarii]|uniref:signal peptidase II n=1 Tax=Exiguobacterium aestuarii TaxID=273527 RepID=UPI001CD65967|nr:signal peptidase II [Exiguobacterium aestuarii]MCA0979905.1 signal peptidase II [Exiguobacterium aestuarii]